MNDLGQALRTERYRHVAFTELFRQLKECNYPLRAVVCDNGMTIKSALAVAYPRAKIQLCQNHYLENLRQLLHVRTEETYHQFFASLRDRVFLRAHTDQQVTQALGYVMACYAKNNTLLRDIIFEIHTRRDILFQYLSIPDCPCDTNLVELYNSHLQARLKSIKSFQFVPAASRWLNAYLIRRRNKTLTDCELKFKHLNGYPSLFWTIKEGINWPNILGVKIPKHFLQISPKQDNENYHWFQSAP